MTKVFISYRREDSVYVCDRIYDALAEEFGKENVFRDKSSIIPGANFQTRIEEAVNKCQILLAVMGDRWLKLTDEHGRRRIDRSDDWVAIEIRTALDRIIPVIPVLIENIHMPPSAALPTTLDDLHKQDAIELRSGDDFDKDIERLKSAIREWLEKDALETEAKLPLQVREAASASEHISIVTLRDPAHGLQLTLEENNSLLANIKQLLLSVPHTAKISINELVDDTGDPGVFAKDFQAIIKQELDDKQILAVSLHDDKRRIPEDLQPWKLNLRRFSRKREQQIDFYHNGDNALPAPFRAGSYGRDVPYSIVKFAAQIFPELESADQNLVYLGSLPMRSDDPTTEDFADVRRRLALYRFARWLWLWDHPRRSQ